MRTSVVLFASLTIVAPCELRAEPSPFISPTSPTAAELRPGVASDLRWSVPNGSSWFAGWIACSGAASDTKDCNATFDPVAAGALVAELAFPKLWDAVLALPFGPDDESAALFVAATNHGAAPSSGSATGGDSPKTFADDKPVSVHDANDDHATGGSPVAGTDDHDKAVTATPEPATLLLAASGFTALAGVARRRRLLRRE
jgi:hypothetical protein